MAEEERVDQDGCAGRDDEAGGERRLHAGGYLPAGDGLPDPTLEWLLKLGQDLEGHDPVMGLRAAGVDGGQQQLPLLGKALEGHPARQKDAFGGRVGGKAGIAGRPHHPAHEVVRYGAEGRLLGGEVKVEGALGYPRPSHDIAHGGVLVALFGEKSSGRRHQSGPPGCGTLLTGHAHHPR